MTHWNNSLFFLILMVKDYSRSLLLCWGSGLCDLLILFQISGFSHDEVVPICSCANWYFGTNSSNPSQVFTPDVFIGNNPSQHNFHAYSAKRIKFLYTSNSFICWTYFTSSKTNQANKKSPDCWSVDLQRTGEGDVNSGKLLRRTSQCLSKHSLGHDTVASLIFKQDCVWQLAAVELVGGFPSWLLLVFQIWWQTAALQSSLKH